MKKMMMILTMVFGLSVVFVSCATTSSVDTSVVIDTGDWLIITSNNKRPLDFGELSDTRKAEICKSSAPEEINGKHLRYEGLEFNKVDPIAEMYYSYFLVKKDKTYMAIVSNIGGGRELILYYRLEDIVE